MSKVTCGRQRDGVTFDWENGLLFSWKWFDVFYKMACLTDYIYSVYLCRGLVVIFRPVICLNRVKERFVRDEITCTV